MIDSTERDCRHCNDEFEQLLPPLRGMVYEIVIIGLKFVRCTCMYTVLTIDVRTDREMILFRFSEYMSFKTVSNSCILATLFHDCDIKQNCNM